MSVRFDESIPIDQKALMVWLVKYCNMTPTEVRKLFTGMNDESNKWFL